MGMGRQLIPLPKRPPRPDCGEATILRRIREALGAMPGVVVWRNNTGMLEDRNGTKVRFGLCEGSADLVGMSGGRFLAIEVKAPGKRPGAVQLGFLNVVNKLGGYGEWVTSVDAAVRAAENCRDGVRL